MSNKEHITSIGGQAVMEGVMMRGPHKTAIAVRKPDGEIITKIDENGTKKRNAFFRLPIVRGCVNFIDSMIVGVKALMFSAEFVDLEEEDEKPSKLEAWLEAKLGDKMKDAVIYIAVALSVVLSVGLFILLPTAVTSGVEWLYSLISKTVFSGAVTSLIEGIVRMIIFIGYMVIVSFMPDIRRVYEYHGAEHKTIACYEAGDELTVENVSKYTRLHPRCGTSFLLFVMVISILLFSILPRTGIILRMVMRLALLPVVAGLSYEVIKLAGRSKNKCVAFLTKPGLWLQKLTTREPDASQLEVAIQSMVSVIPEDKEEDKW